MRNRKQWMIKIGTSEATLFVCLRLSVPSWHGPTAFLGCLFRGRTREAFVLFENDTTWLLCHTGIRRWRLLSKIAEKITCLVPSVLLETQGGPSRRGSISLALAIAYRIQSSSRTHPLQSPLTLGFGCPTYKPLRGTAQQAIKAPFNAAFSLTRAQTQIKRSNSTSIATPCLPPSESLAAPMLQNNPELVRNVPRWKRPRAPFACRSQLECKRPRAQAQLRALCTYGPDPSAVRIALWVYAVSTCSSCSLYAVSCFEGGGCGGGV